MDTRNRHSLCFTRWTIASIIAMVSLIAGCEVIGHAESSLPNLGDRQGFLCYRRQNVASGFAFASYEYLDRKVSIDRGFWLRDDDPYTVDILFSVTKADDPSSLGELLAALTVKDLPPLGTRIVFRLSGGQLSDAEFSPPQIWHAQSESKDTERSGGFVAISDKTFVEHFLSAQWVDVDLVTQSETTLDHARIELSNIRSTNALARQLMDAVREDATKFRERCQPIG